MVASGEGNSIREQTIPGAKRRTVLIVRLRPRRRTSSAEQDIASVLLDAQAAKSSFGR